MYVCFNEFWKTHHYVELNPKVRVEHSLKQTARALNIASSKIATAEITQKILV